jgi:hypothetical protein
MVLTRIVISDIYTKTVCTSVGSTNVKMLCWVVILYTTLKKQAETRRFVSIYVQQYIQYNYFARFDVIYDVIANLFARNVEFLLVFLR